MLEIGEAQMCAIARPGRREVAWHFTNLYRRRFGAVIDPLGPQEALARVERELEAGVDLGLRSQRDLYVFVSFALMFGWAYRTAGPYRWVDRLMRDRQALPPKERLALVIEMLDARA